MNKAFRCALALVGVVVLLLVGCSKAGQEPDPKAVYFELQDEDARWMQSLAASWSAVYELDWGELEAELTVDLYEDGISTELGGIYGLMQKGKCALMLKETKDAEGASQLHAVVSINGATISYPLDITRLSAASSQHWDYGAESFVSGATLPLYCVYFTNGSTMRSLQTIEDALEYDIAVVFNLRLQ